MKIYVTENLFGVDHITISQINVTLGESAAIIVLLEDASDEEIFRPKTVKIEGVDYDNWSTEDLPYISDIVLDRLGYTAREQDGYS